MASFLKVLVVKWQNIWRETSRDLIKSNKRRLLNWIGQPLSNLLEVISSTIPYPSKDLKFKICKPYLLVEDFFHSEIYVNKTSAIHLKQTEEMESKILFLVSSDSVVIKECRKVKPAMEILQARKALSKSTHCYSNRAIAINEINQQRPIFRLGYSSRICSTGFLKFLVRTWSSEKWEKVGKVEN